MLSIISINLISFIINIVIIYNIIKNVDLYSKNKYYSRITDNNPILF